MIKIFTGKTENFEYESRSIIASFFPGQEIIFCGGESGARESGGAAEARERGGAAEARECDGAAEAGAEKHRGAVERDAAETTLDFDKIIPDGVTDKNEKRRLLYAHLSELTGHGLPWGILTGVRPTKLTMQRLIAGDSIPQAAAFMQDEYLVSPEKSVLAAVISARELQVAARVLEAGANAAETASQPGMVDAWSDAATTQPGQAATPDLTLFENGYSLYVGIPFCPSRCLYCSFASQPISAWEGRTGLYLDALFRELEATAELMRGRELHSIYVGGGTPTALSAGDLKLVLEKINSFFDKSRCLEFTVEAGRPDSITAEKLQVIKAAGANRISINPQTMNDETLELIGRKHKTADIIEKFALARSLGFDNINMDIILGLTGENAGHVARSIEQISALGPDSLTVHALAVKRASRLNMETTGTVMPGMGDNVSAQMMQIASRGAGAMGLAPYYLYRQKNMAGSLENVGYAIPGKEGVYNILMMEEMESIIACGAGTVTKRVRPGRGKDAAPDAKTQGRDAAPERRVMDAEIERCDCPKDVEQYIARIDEMIERKRALFA